MFRRVASLLALTVLVASPAICKDKKKSLLPDDILRARTVYLMVSPDAGMSLEHPRANSEALQQVEQALTAWGRFTLVLEGRGADLVIAVRAGSGRLVSPTIENGPTDTRIGTMQPRNGGIGIGAEQGRGPAMSDPTMTPRQTGPHMGNEIGRADDSFEVYRGGVSYALDSPAVWRYVAKDGLKPPGIPAVEQFRKAIADAEKQQRKP
jgi:hypothetical protein